MDVIQEIEKVLRDVYSSGLTQQEMAERMGVSQVHVGRLLSGKRKIEKMELETFLKLFPNAQVILNAESATSGNYSPIVKGKQSVGINNGTIHNCEQDIEHFRHKIQDEVIRSDVEPEAKVKILNIILNTKV